MLCLMKILLHLYLNIFNYKHFLPLTPLTPIYEDVGIFIKRVEKSRPGFERFVVWDDMEDIWHLTHPQNLDNLTMKISIPIFSYFQVKWYPLPPQNIPFLAYLHELEQLKKSVKRKFLQTPPTPKKKCEIAHFFSIEKVPNDPEQKSKNFPLCFKQVQNSQWNVGFIKFACVVGDCCWYCLKLPNLILTTTTTTFLKISRKINCSVKCLSIILPRSENILSFGPILCCKISACNFIRPSELKPKF